MSIHLIQHIDRLKKLLLEVGSMVETALQKAMRAMESRDVLVAREVIDSDREIDLKEIDVEEECLTTLAMHQPVAHDLRFIVAVLKINRDLERIGDLAVNIAEQAVGLEGQLPVDLDQVGIREMGQKAQIMLKQSLDSFVDLDTALAQQVRQADDEVDHIHRSMYATVETIIGGRPDQFDQAIRLLNTARQLERVADHAANIAEDVIYLTQGQIVRHSHTTFQSHEPINTRDF